MKKLAKLFYLGASILVTLFLLTLTIYFTAISSTGMSYALFLKEAALFLFKGVLIVSLGLVTIAVCNHVFSLLYRKIFKNM